jgi:hypothetical protein
MGLNNNFGNRLSELNNKIEYTYKKNTKLITDTTSETVEKCEDIQNSSKK